MDELRQRFHYEEAGSELASILQSIVIYLVSLEKKIDRNTASLETVTTLLKGKDKVGPQEETEGEVVKKEPHDKLVKNVMKRVTSEKFDSSKKEPERPAEKEEPTKKEEPVKEAEKPKKKEKVKMKLSFMYNNKKDENLLLWIGEIQTYCGTAPVEPESQVAFSTSCLGGVVKEWVLAEANAVGFEDIEEDSFPAHRLEHPNIVLCSVSLDDSIDELDNELIALRSSWAKKAKSKGELMITDIEVTHTRAGALLDPGSTRSYISEKAIRKLHLGMKVKYLPRPIMFVPADKSTITVSQYVDRVKCYFRIKEGKKILHEVSFLVEKNLPFDMILGMDWHEEADPELPNLSFDDSKEEVGSKGDDGACQESRGQTYVPTHVQYAWMCQRKEMYYAGFHVCISFTKSVSTNG
ncbi:hypothetical protein CBR_g49088 [Chara braunii]|uniref:Uncharacterized protein n=1 Tax=Chara braunii TaxID=69332 RepID=A0A388K4S4_CHABU|nr:hypothetical protein CBR_g49088 [Chara braunii]|eukprot:GBG65019.1 hypothetical protein CBR_g49088 [Chara braunii]